MMKIAWKLFLLLILAEVYPRINAYELSSNHTQLLNKQPDRDVVKVKCIDADPSVIRNNEIYRKKCCEGLHKGFYRSWTKYSRRLGANLNVLYLWNCSQFEEECRARTFAFTEFTSNLYDKFCEPSYCNMSHSIQLPSSNETSHDMESRAVRGLGSEDSTKSNLSKENERENMPLASLLDPCIQASLVEKGSVIKSEYFEVKEINVPFCQIIWCAFSAQSFVEHDISISTCMPQRCRVNLYIYMAVTAILCACIVVANLTVVMVFVTSRRMLNSQTVFKISLAVADLLNGIFVLPAMIETTRRSFLLPFTLVEENDPVGSSIRTKLVPGESSTAFINAFGCLTGISMMVSIYTLLVASCDRFYIVFRPLFYDKFLALRAAKISVAILWFLAVIFSVLPFFIEDLFYTFVSSVFIALGGHVALIVYSVLIILPLVLVWILNVATLVFYRKNSKKANSVRPGSQTGQVDKTERRLAKTLSLMVGTFTLCLLPLVITMLSTLFISGINTGNPKSLKPTKAIAVISVEAVTVFILMTNSLWNFFIYSGRSPEFRKRALTMYQRILSKFLPESACLSSSKQTDSTQKRITFRRFTRTRSQKTNDTSLSSSTKEPGI